MKATIQDNELETGEKRGLFRRHRRPAAAHSSTVSTPPVAPMEAVATVDDLARRIDELTAASKEETPDSIRAAFELQRAAIARANDSAATGSGHAPVPTVATIPSLQSPENTVDQTHTDTIAELDTDAAELEARLDAALAPVQLPTPIATPAPTVAAAQPTVTPTVTPATPAPSAPAAELRPTAPKPTQAATVSAAPTASSLLGIDVERLVRLIEDEAVATKQRIELEVRSSHEQAEEVVERAEAEAERIREHGQNQARVLLGEVEEIISEAQQTGEQILLRANTEASTLRKDATAVLHQAQAESRAIIDTARREGEQVLAEQRRLATLRAQEAMREQDRLKDQIRRLEERRRQVLESLEPLISQLTQMMPAVQQAEDTNVVQLDRSRG
ncbi:MAG: hypothetical protein JWM90_1928 [Thermoleophilia bacterium]|nr:hypothetical protein [Thermoleophilia bacterium]